MRVPPQRLDNDMLAAQIEGLPSAWNCKHSGGTLVRTFQKNPQLGILGSALRVCILPLGHQREQGVLWSVRSKSYIRKNVSQQMLSIPLQTVNWKMVEGLLPAICPILSPSFSCRNGKHAVVVTLATEPTVSTEYKNIESQTNVQHFTDKLVVHGTSRRIAKVIWMVLIVA